ncbi:hypothetical protein [Streptomyces johnsoniae]|uniref:Uncharacterized protein n=1 Tax=Streptomyces johnsoniae TaxID=3075532 RepID=A0ABU2S9V8_9ACTN|nr:hypothetical protein [Streptomyces sp. DSM 41886]MDT0445608.1 hypothetical protein [Streptomyces sp. DSM 41886]
MDPHGPIAQRFPLVARFRPACLPLTERVHALVDLADTAARKADQGRASAVYNQSALLASDLNLPELARELCHQHAAAYLRSCPLPAMSAIRGLEPVVNLARIQIRAGRTDDGRQRLLSLHQAVSTGTAAQFDDVVVPADLTATSGDRHEVRSWLWRVLLADGTRTLTTQGRWTEALAHIEEHRGVGTRMLDGRQVSVLAALATSDVDRARTLIEDTAPGEPWEQAVTACLAALCCRVAGQPVDRHHVDRLVSTYAELKPERGMTVFGTRLGLAILDVIGTAEEGAAHRVVNELHHRTAKLGDGYAARENLAHPLFTALATDRQQQDCRDLVYACGLGSGKLPDELHDQLTVALRISDHTIRDSVACPEGDRDPGEVMSRALVGTGKEDDASGDGPAADG